jgi:hypothetical protein
VDTPGSHAGSWASNLQNIFQHTKENGWRSSPAVAVDQCRNLPVSATTTAVATAAAAVEYAATTTTPMESTTTTAAVESAGSAYAVAMEATGAAACECMAATGITG